jgi:thiamine biosynthesis lipoprotein
MSALSRQKRVARQLLTTAGALLGCWLLCNHRVAAAQLAETQRWQHTVLDQSFQLTLRGVSQAELTTQLPALLQQLQLLQQALDGSKPDSALSRFNQSGQTTDSHVLQLLQLCEHWWRQTRAYHCRLGQIRQQWQQAEQQAELPDRIALRQQVRQLRQLDSRLLQRQSLPSQQQISKASRQQAGHWYQLDGTGLNAAMLLDQLLPQVQQWWPQASQWQLQLAGITLVRGEAFPAKVQFQRAATGTRANNQPHALTQLMLQQQALAYSLHPRRGDRPYRLSHRQFSPLLSPEDGWPLDYAPQVAAIANSASSAWLLAQSLAATPVAAHQALFDQLATIADATTASALLQPEQGPLLAAGRWYELLAEPSLRHSALSLKLTYQLPQHGPTAKRPYLSIWLADDQFTLVRQLSLQGEQSRWLAELRSWWKLQRQQPQLLDSISSATRKSGQYQLQWDGRDQQGKPLPAGQYVLWLEAAREDGGHEKIKLALRWQANQHGCVQGRTEWGQICWQVLANPPTPDQRKPASAELVRQQEHR